MLALRILPVTVTVFNDREELDCCEHCVGSDGSPIRLLCYLRRSISPLPLRALGAGATVVHVNPVRFEVSSQEQFLEGPASSMQSLV